MWIDSLVIHKNDVDVVGFMVPLVEKMVSAVRRYYLELQTVC